MHGFSLHALLESMLQSRWPVHVQRVMHLLQIQDRPCDQLPVHAASHAMSC